MSATQINWTGLDMYLYRNTGTNASPTWVLVDNVIDLKRGASLQEAELNSRKSKEVQKEPTLQERVYSWGMIPDETDANYPAIRTAKDNRTLQEFAFANGAIATSGTTYTRQECKIFQFDEDQPLTGGIGAQVTAKPCKSSFAPAVVTVP